MELERAGVSWFLSIDESFVPAEVRARGQRTYRSITIDGEEIEFSGGFTDLHTEVYRRTITGNGFGLEDTRTAIRTTERIRTVEPGGRAPRHPFLER
jgi:UDP-N-acetyl-2-amino-2-deoxyglucuronate dehydrogenase